MQIIYYLVPAPVQLLSEAEPEGRAATIEVDQAKGVLKYHNRPAQGTKIMP
jgi:hypothetical protein